MGGRSVVMACTVAKPCRAPDGVSPPPASPILGPVSPLEAPTISEPIIELTAAAHAKLLELRADEEEPERLGLRLEVVSAPGADFRYGLSFDVVTKAAFTDEVRNHDGLRVIIPGKDMEAVRGATLDYSDEPDSFFATRTVRRWHGPRGCSTATSCRPGSRPSSRVR